MNDTRHCECCGHCKRKPFKVRERLTGRAWFLCRPCFNALPGYIWDKRDWSTVISGPEGRKQKGTGAGA